MSLGTRGAARLVDALLLAALGVAWGRPFGYGVGWLLMHALLVYGYFVAGDAVFGATFGKRLFGIAVRGADGERPGWGAAARREAFVLLGAVPFVGPLVALGAWIAIARAVRRGDAGFHDRWAGTRVVAALPVVGSAGR
jgi:uncharacterized RDD family membrane protein YckC